MITGCTIKLEFTKTTINDFIVIMSAINNSLIKNIIDQQWKSAH